MRIVVIDESQDVNKPEIQLLTYSDTSNAISFADDDYELSRVELFLNKVLGKVKAIRKLNIS